MVGDFSQRDSHVPVQPPSPLPSGAGEAQAGTSLLGSSGGSRGVDAALAVGSSPSGNACLTHSRLACLRTELLLQIKCLLMSQEPNPSLQSCVFSEIAEKSCGRFEEAVSPWYGPLPIYMAGPCATSRAHRLHTWSSWRWSSMVLPWKRCSPTLIK